jgi:hypothetical protein
MAAHGEILVGRLFMRQPMSDSFIPFRRNIRYTNCKETKIRSLLEQLSLTRGEKN